MLNKKTDYSVKKGLNTKLLLTAVITAVISVFISFAVFCLFFFKDGLHFKLSQIKTLVDNNFYGTVNSEKLSDSVAAGYINGLDDKFASYYNREDAEERSDSLNGTGSGIGIIVSMHPDTGNIYVKNVYENGPAAKAGIQVSDQIISVDGKNVAETGYSQAVSSIAGKIGDTVNLTLMRGNTTFTVAVKYSQFTTQTVFLKMLSGGVGYIEITAFNNETPVQFKNGVNKLTSQGAKGLIFDLRGNGGGTVDSVIEMVDFLCPKGTTMTLKFASGEEKIIGESKEDEVNLPMTVLTDSSTASASELFTASVKDFGKGISIGEKTFGKGVMQTTYNLYDGSSVCFTVAEFLPHSGISFNGVGIAPDIPVTLTEHQQKYKFQLSWEEDPVILAAVNHLNEK